MLRKLVLIAIALWILIGCTAAWFRHTNLVTAQYDLGNMDQVLWQTLHGHFFSYTSPNRAVLEPRAAVHTDYLLLAYLPFYVLWPDPRVMMFVQVAAVGSGAWVVWRMARERLRPPEALALILLYLLYPPLLWTVSFDVHAVVLVIPLCLWAYLAAQHRRWGWYAVLCAAMMLAKEEVGILVAMLGVYFLFRRQTRTAGWLSFVAGIVATTVALGWIIPYFRNAPGHFADAYYSDFGSTPGAVVATAFQHPWEIFGRLFSSDGLSYIWMLLWPLAAFSILGWEFLFLALPFIALNVLSAEPNLRSIYYHYTATITPFLFLASISGAVRLQRWLARHVPWKKPVLTGLVLLGLSGIYVWAPLPGTRHHADAVRVFKLHPARAEVAAVKKLVTAADTLAVTNTLGPQFSRRRAIWLFPLALDRADAVIVLLGENGDIASPAELQTAVEQLRTDPNWVLKYHRDRLWFFRKAFLAGTL